MQVAVSCAMEQRRKSFDVSFKLKSVETAKTCSIKAAACEFKCQMNRGIVKLEGAVSCPEEGKSKNRQLDGGGRTSGLRILLPFKS